MNLNLVFELDQRVVKFGIFCFGQNQKGFKNMMNQAQTHTRKAYLNQKD
jgi:hypothetical protein